MTPFSGAHVVAACSAAIAVPTASPTMHTTNKLFDTFIFFSLKNYYLKGHIMSIHHKHFFNTNKRLIPPHSNTEKSMHQARINATKKIVINEKLESCDYVF